MAVTYDVVVEDASFRVQDKPPVLPPFHDVRVLVELAPKLLPQLVDGHSAFCLQR